MKREFLKKAGKSETEIQQELDKIYPDNINARIGEFGEEAQLETPDRLANAC